MRLAIATDGNSVAEHFGRCPEYTLIDIENNQIANKTMLKNPGHTPGAIPKLMNDNKVDCMIAGGMGHRAKIFFEDFGIETIIGIYGTIDDVIEKFLSGTLEGGDSLCGGGHGDCDHHH